MGNSGATQLVNPFVGLRSFEEAEDYLFFGRGRQIGELLKKLNESRFLAVIGSSGSGKSSLVKSGLMPAIYSGFMTVGSNWRVVLMQPGENPLGYLTRQLVAEAVLHETAGSADIPHELIIEASLRRSENGLVQVYKDAQLPPNEHVLIVVDQFEELFRFSRYEKENKFGKSDAMHFVQILLTAAQQTEYPVYVLLTMRADFLGDCAEFRGLPEAINQGQYLVPRMTREEIREAIAMPVAVSGATISQRLVTRLLNDINNDTDQLPILQHAMMRTWEAWHKRGKFDTPIDFEDYEKIGTMASSLSQHADEAYNELQTGKEKQVCELMFKALTDRAADKRGVRRPRSIADLCLLTAAEQDEITGLVEIFRKPGRTFLMPPPHVPLNNYSIIDISHESLMRVWDRLVKWTEEEGRSGDLYTRLANSAELKEQGQRGLLKDPELAIALKWKENNHPTAKWAEGYKGDFEKAMFYLNESRDEDIAEKKRLADLAEKELLAEKQAAKRKLKNLIFLLMLFLLAGAVSSTFYFINLSGQLKDSVRETTTEAENAKKAQHSMQLARDSAVTERTMAVMERYRADSLALLAGKSRDTALIARHRADSSALAAIRLKKIAEESAVLAETQKKIANQQRDIVANQNLKIAANEYARLIREGPTNKIKIEKDSFDYKLPAYCMHLDSLRRLIEKINDPKAVEDYNALREKLYFNNDLYEKVYACLETVADANAKKAVFDAASYSGTLGNELDTGSIIYKRLYELPGDKIIAIAGDQTGRRIICSSADNWIYVYADANKRLVLENKIPMGARVTALDYNTEKGIIYFGIESGDIGYILYNKDRKNQPVYENSLGSAVTAIQLFKYEVSGGSRNFLLVAAKKSRVVVYELDELADKGPVLDKKLSGNILPEKKLLEVVGARFAADAKDNKKVIIKVRSKKGGESFYAWNPFTAEILEEYKRYKAVPGFKEKYFDPANFYNKGK